MAQSGQASALMDAAERSPVKQFLGRPPTAARGTRYALAGRRLRLRRVHALARPGVDRCPRRSEGCDGIPRDHANIGSQGPAPTAQLASGPQLACVELVADGIDQPAFANGKAFPVVIEDATVPMQREEPKRLS